jgi:hypothetical protein
MGALSKLIFGGDKYVRDNKYVTPGPATLELGLTEADLSNKGLQTAGAIIVAAWISHRDKGAISTVVVNKFPLPIQDIKSKAELNFSGKGLEVEDAIIIAALIPSNVSHKPYISLLLSLISTCL